MTVAVIRLATGVVLLSASAGKLFNLRRFTLALAEYDVVPTRAIPIAARVFAVVELSLAVALLGGLVPTVATLGAAACFCVFAVLVERETRRARQHDCGCLGGVVKLRLTSLSVKLNGFITVALILTLVSSGSARPPLAIWLCAVLLAGTYWLVFYAASVVAVINEDTGLAPVGSHDD